MKKECILFSVVGLLVGVVMTALVVGQAVNNNNTTIMQIAGIDIVKDEQDTAVDHSTMSMADMNKELENLSGDDYDKAFIEMMIAHHEGAVDMSQLSADRAKHNEIKQLSREIIEAQETEIAQMRQWQQDWGYTVDEMMQMMHGNH